MLNQKQNLLRMIDGQMPEYVPINAMMDPTKPPLFAGAMFFNPSILGDFGRGCQKFSLDLLDHGLCHYIASDAHSTSRAFRQTECKKFITENYGEETANILFEENPKRLLANEQPLERMGDFFNRRFDGYEEHQLKTIASAEEFYPFTADCLPKVPGSRILDLGCGTGLELRYYFDIVPTAEITGIDLASGMLEALKEKFPGKTLTLIHGSYFDIPLEENAFDAVVSVESLHHFTKEEKIPLYEKVRKALKPGRYFILTDYFAASNEEEESRRTEFLRLRKEQGICDDAFYHFDTPLTVDHEKEALLIAGFSSVTILGAWGPTYTLKAER